MEDCEEMGQKKINVMWLRPIGVKGAIRNVHLNTLNAIDRNTICPYTFKRRINSFLVPMLFGWKMDVMVGVGNLKEIPIVLWNKLLGVKYVCEIHTCHNRVKRNKGFLKVQWWGMRLLMEMADKTVFVSEFSRKSFKWPKSRSRVIHNSVDTDFFHPSRRKRIGKPLVLWVGKLTPTKRPEVFRKVAEMLPEYEFVMIDKGKSRNEIAQLMADADIFLFPSREEPFGLVVIEAMASGCPVVLSKAGAFPEITCRELIKVNRDEARNMAKRIKLLVENLSLWKGVSEYCRKRAMEFSPGKIALKHQNLYKSLLYDSK